MSFFFVIPAGFKNIRFVTGAHTAIRNSECATDFHKIICILGALHIHSTYYIIYDTNLLAWLVIRGIVVPVMYLQLRRTYLGSAAHKTWTKPTLPTIENGWQSKAIISPTLVVISAACGSLESQSFVLLLLSSKIPCFKVLLLDYFVSCYLAEVLFSSSYFLNSGGCFHRWPVVKDFTDCSPLNALALQMLQDAWRSLSPAVKNCHIDNLLFDILINNRSTCRIT